MVLSGRTPAATTISRHEHTGVGWPRLRCRRGGTRSPDRLGDDQFATFANEALVELEERYGVTTPIEDQVQELTGQYYRGLEVLQALDEPMTVDELTAELELDTDEVRNYVAYLAEFDRVSRDSETVRSAK